MVTPVLVVPEAIAPEAGRTAPIVVILRVRLSSIALIFFIFFIFSVPLQNNINYIFGFFTIKGSSKDRLFKAFDVNSLTSEGSDERDREMPHVSPKSLEFISNRI